MLPARHKTHGPSAVTGRATGLATGLLSGVVWWLLGPLTLMPLSMGMGLGVNWNLTAATNMLPSLMGHAIFGLVLGLVYSRGENCLVFKVGRKASEDVPVKPGLHSVG